jgi:hypothetical protein
VVDVQEGVRFVDGESIDAQAVSSSGIGEWEDCVGGGVTSAVIDDDGEGGGGGGGDGGDGGDGEGM